MHTRENGPAKRAAKPATVVATSRRLPAKAVASTRPQKFTYALAAYTAERRPDGWYAGKTVPGFTSEKPKWSGPFETIEHCCLSIARYCAVEIADRHTRSIACYKIERTDGLFGLKPTTKLKRR